MPQVEMGRGTNGPRTLKHDGADDRPYENGITNGGFKNTAPNGRIEHAGVGYSSPVDTRIATPARNF